MTGFQNNAQAYVETFGTKQIGNIVVLQRNPSGTDVNFPIGQFWLNQSNEQLYYLLSQSNASGQLMSTWQLISASSVLVTLSDTGNSHVVAPSSASSSPPNNIQIAGGTGITVVGNSVTNTLTITNTGSGTETITGDDGTPVSPLAGTILLEGKVVNNGTHVSKAVFTESSGAANQENIDIQVTTTIAAADVTKVGLAAFNSAQFQVDGGNAGFISLKGSTTAGPILGLVPDAHTNPGTTPVIANSSGNITLEGGATFATATQANPIRTNSLAANTIDLQIQLSGSNPAVSTANNFGVSQFDSNQFTVTGGFVKINNGGTTGAVTKIQGDDSMPVVPSSGIITFTGIVVNNGTNPTSPVYFKKNATSIEELDVQLTTTSTSGSKNKNNAGLASFDSTSFSVDSSTGFVSFTGGSGPVTLTLTGDAGGAVGPTSGNINIKGDTTTTYILGNPGTSTLTVKVASALNSILYGAGAATSSNVLSPSNDSVLTSGTSGIPQWTSLASDGQIIIGSSAGAPLAANITGTGGITITNGHNSIQINGSPSMLTWNLVAANVTNMTTNNGYICISPGGALTLGLPLVSAKNDIIEVILDGATSWTITQAAGQQIRYGNQQSTAGASGTLASNNQGDSIRLLCEIANLRWLALSGIGTLTIT